MTLPSSLLVTGATGTLGRSLLSRLSRLEEVSDVRVLSRDPARAHKALGLAAYGWDGTGAVPRAAVEGIDAVVHLAGEPVAEGRWSAAKKRAIEQSRISGTRALVESLRQHGARPAVMVSASAVGFYGDRGDEELDERSAPGRGFLPDVCVGWEREAKSAEGLGTRVVALRIGVVLAREGGALPRMLPPFRVGLGASLGSGRQWMPWIHVDDVVGLVLHALRTDTRGPMNAVAPSPVRNEELTRVLAHVLQRPALLRAPAFVLRAALGEVAGVVLGSQRVVPRVAEASGYRFQHPDLEEALRHLLQARDAAPAPHAAQGTT